MQISPRVYRSFFAYCLLLSISTSLFASLEPLSWNGQNHTANLQTLSSNPTKPGEIELTPRRKRADSHNKGEGPEGEDEGWQNLAARSERVAALKTYIGSYIGHEALDAIEAHLLDLDKLSLTEGLEAVIKTFNNAPGQHFLNQLVYDGLEPVNERRVSLQDRRLIASYVKHSLRLLAQTREEEYFLAQLTKGLKEQEERLQLALTRLSNIRTPWGPLSTLFSVKSSQCFTGETLILVKGQDKSLEYKAIKDVTLNDKVWTCKLETKACVLKKVKSWQEHTSSEVLSLTFLDQRGQEQVIQVTPDHPFSVGKGKWQAANRLKVGSYLKDLDGKKRKLIKRQRKQGSFSVYSLAVNANTCSNNNYFVSKMGFLVRSCQTPKHGPKARTGMELIADAYIDHNGLVLTPGEEADNNTKDSAVKIAKAQDFAAAVADPIADAAIVLTARDEVVGLSSAEKGLWLAKKGQQGLAAIYKLGTKLLEVARKIGLSSAVDIKAFTQVLIKYKLPLPDWPSTIRFSIHLKKHLSTCDGFTQQAGLKGTHNLQAFEQAVLAKGLRIIKMLSHTLSPGITQVEYELPKLDKMGLSTGEFKGHFQKTVYDPAVISDTEITHLGQIAAAAGFEAAFSQGLREYNAEAGGLGFRVFLEGQTIVNTFPRL